MELSYQDRLGRGRKTCHGHFNKETKAICQQLAKSAKLEPVRNILLNSFPSQTLLFSDDMKIAKAMEAADRHRPYPPKPTFNRSSVSKFRGGVKVTWTPYQKPKSIQSLKPRSRENPKAALFTRREAAF
jgi:hypothetical protein